MKSVRNLLAILAIASIANLAAAQEKFIIAGGGGLKNGSTYSAMIGDLAGVCSTDNLVVEEQNTNGGVKNLELIRNGQVEGALVPTSLLYAAKLDNPASVAQIRTLVTLHTEEVHVLAFIGSKKEGGWGVGKMKFGQNEVSYNTIEDLKGRPVGAVGGSVVDARVLSDILRLGFKVTSYPDNNALKEALIKGDIDAAVVVAGAPSGFVAALPAGQFKLLTLRGNGDTNAVYKPVKLSYDNLGDGKSVDTLGTQALLVSRSFRSPTMLASLSALRSCFQKNLPMIQDKRGSHPKWQDVDANDQGKWEWYQLTKAGAAPSKK